MRVLVQPAATNDAERRASLEPPRPPSARGYNFWRAMRVMPVGHPVSSGSDTGSLTPVLPTETRDRPSTTDWASRSDGRTQTRHLRFQWGARWLIRYYVAIALWFAVALCAANGPQLRYPPRFKALVAVLSGLSLMLSCNYLFVVVPTIHEDPGEPCRYNDKQLVNNAQMLFVYFLWFGVARVSLFVPWVATKVITVHTRTHGYCCVYCVHLFLRDGPLYIFVLGSMFFWFHLMQAPTCEERSPSFYRVLRLHAIYSNLVSMFCLILAYWHNKVLADAASEVFENGIDRRGGGGAAPPFTVHMLETMRYDEAFFGDEDGKRYPSECAICLGAWEQMDVIKVTPCGHAFHEECIGGWLRNSRTCALCRRDLTRTGAVATSALRQGPGMAAGSTTVVPQAFGLPMQRPNDGNARLEDV